MGVTIEKDYDDVDVYVVGCENCDCGTATFNVAEVQAAFFSNGFNVTSDAVMHNFQAWSKDYKSGYLDEANGYFLFTPCGCNKLRFTAEKINGEDYQHTYEC